MAFFTCHHCRHMLQAIQVSSKIVRTGEQRNVYYTSTGIQVGPWEPLIPALGGLADGFYCPQCHQPVVVEKDEWPLCEDTRIPSLAADEFSASRMIEQLLPLAEKEEAQTYIHVIPEKPAQYASLSTPLVSPLAEALRRMGITQLYTHQAQTIEAARERKQIVLVTSTASGKTLAYNLPILESLYLHPASRALYIFPTKALANDQFEQLKRFSEGKEESLDHWFEAAIPLGEQTIRIGRLDGDTPDGPRDRILSQANIWMTNPDMIHFFILGQLRHKRRKPVIQDFLRQLKWVVLDEMHLYRGTFGSHVALVLRRLLKVCKELGNENIQVIASSATIENPGKLAQDLTGKGPFTLIDQDGSMHKKKVLLFWNPGMSADDSVRRAPSTDAITIAKHALTEDRKVIKSIIFQPSRIQTMVFTRKIKDVLRQPLKLSKEKVEGERLAAYYTGILPNETRKRIIHRLKSHEIHVIVSTNALEVGIDIGDLSAALLLGYPGSKAAFSQQVGRVGRKGEGVAILIWQDDPLQQYYMRNPQDFIHKPPEIVRVNPANSKLLTQHLPLLAEELGRALTREDLRDLLPPLPDDAIDHILQAAADHGEEDPARFSLRSISGKTYHVKERNRGEILIESLDEWSALRDFHEGAIYWTPGDQAFRVTSISRKNGEIIVQPLSELTYHTQSSYKDSIDILQIGQISQAHPRWESFYGDLQIKRTVFGYKKIFFGHKQEPEPVNFPQPYSTKFPSEGTWILLHDALWKEFLGLLEPWAAPTKTAERLAEGSLHALQHAMTAVIPDIIICDANDFTGFSAINASAFAQRPVVGFYGESGAGIGIIEAIFENYETVLKRALQLISSCPCREGCPSCVQLPGAVNGELFKPGAVLLLQRLLEGGE